MEDENKVGESGRREELVSTSYEAGKKAGEIESFNTGFVAGVVFTCLIGWFFKGGSK